jgi:hypothetical protein
MLSAVSHLKIISYWAARVRLVLDAVHPKIHPTIGASTGGHWCVAMTGTIALTC